MELFLSACRTCSTIIFPHSTNQVLDLRRSRVVDVIDAKSPSWLPTVASVAVS